MEVTSDNVNERKWIVKGNGVIYDLVVNYKENFFKINDEIYPIKVKIVEFPNTFKNESIFYSTYSGGPTINYTTARYYESKVPWKGSLTLFAAALDAILGWKDGAGMASIVAGVLTADAENVWVTFTQYESNEKYHSNYSNIDYNKVINKDIKLYKTSISSGNLIYGPKDGGWFDPVRP